MNSFGHKETCKLVMFWNAINTISSKDEGINVFCDKDNISNVQSYQSIQIVPRFYWLHISMIDKLLHINWFPNLWCNTSITNGFGLIKLLSQYLYSLNVFGIVPLGYHMKALNKWKFVSCICTFTLICSHSYLLQKDAKKNSHGGRPWKKYWYCFITLTYNMKLIMIRYLHSYAMYFWSLIENSNS